MKRYLIIGVLCFTAGVLCGMREEDIVSLFRCSVKEVSFAGPHHMALVGKVYYPPAHIFWKHYPGIVFCHGMLPRGKDTALYIQLFRHLARRGYLVLAFDLRGFGESAKVANFRIPHDLDWTAEVRAAVAYMRAELPVRRRQITIAGHSLGANLALATGYNAPDVTNLIIISAGCFHSTQRPPGEGKGALLRRCEKMTGHAIDAEQWYRLTKPLDLFSYLPLPERKNIFVVLADCDAANIIQYNRRFHDRLDARKAMATIHNSDHNFGFDMESANEQIDPAPVRQLAAAMDGWLHSHREK